MGELLWRFEATVKAAATLYLIADKILQSPPKYRAECESRLNEKAEVFYRYDTVGAMHPALCKWLDEVTHIMLSADEAQAQKAALVAALQKMVLTAASQATIPDSETPLHGGLSPAATRPNQLPEHTQPLLAVHAAA